MRSSALLPMLAITTAILAAACAPAPSRSGQTGDPRAQSAGQEAARTLVVLGRTEPANLSMKIADTGSNATTSGIKGLFNLDIARLDERKSPHPGLVERLPELNSDTWRVFPDGRMETTYRLRPNLAWHDGAALSAEDFLFAWQVYQTPDLGFKIAPQNLMEEVAAVDDRTFVIRWKRGYPEADALGGNDFPPLPRHILDAAFQRGPSEAFMSHPWWNREYIGLGPYRVERWQPGAFIEGAAFEGYALGRPKIERVKAIWASDPNSALANLLSEAAHLSVDASIAFPQGLLLKREWAPRNTGTVLMTPTEVRFIHVQHRPEVATPPIRDVRVRKAVAHAIDRQALIEGVLEGEGKAADTLLPAEAFNPEVDRAVAKYPLDLRRTEQLLAEAGFTRAPDGFYAAPGGARLVIPLWAIAGGQEEQELAILADGFRRTGLETPNHVVPAAQSNDGQVLASFPALFTGKSNLNDNDGGLDKLLSRKAPGPQTRWVGSAIGGYQNPEYDRVYSVFETALDRAERAQAILQMSKIISEDVAAISLYHNFEVQAHVAALRGPRPGLPDSGWQHEWEWVR